MSQRLLLQWYSAAKRPFETQFFKNNLEIDAVTWCFFSVFENPIKLSSPTRDMRKNYPVELDLFIKELQEVEKKIPQIIFFLTNGE